jgi:hypothetical protein
MEHYLRGFPYSRRICLTAVQARFSVTALATFQRGPDNALYLHDRHVGFLVQHGFRRERIGVWPTRQESELLSVRADVSRLLDRLQLSNGVGSLRAPDLVPL